jgi:hypothetical protein
MEGTPKPKTLALRERVRVRENEIVQAVCRGKNG